MRRRRFQLPLLKGGGGLEDAALGDLAKVLGHDGATARNVLLGLWLTSKATFTFNSAVSLKSRGFHFLGEAERLRPNSRTVRNRQRPRVGQKLLYETESVPVTRKTNT